MAYRRDTLDKAPVALSGMRQQAASDEIPSLSDQQAVELRDNRKTEVHTMD
jgi:hypothetical protein